MEKNKIIVVDERGSALEQHYRSKSDQEWRAKIQGLIDEKKETLLIKATELLEKIDDFRETEVEDLTTAVEKLIIEINTLKKLLK